jgi:hypothetical protein
MKHRQPKLIVIATFAFLLSFTAHAKPKFSSYEMTRQEKLANAQDDIQFMDAATPEDLQKLMPAPAFGEMFFENPFEVQSHNGIEVEIDVSIADQSLHATFPGGDFSTIISSARRGYHTATGCFRHPHLELMHYSSKYENSPMPHSMFYYGGYAIHGTMEENHLGRPASHGCVRVSRADAAYLYSIVEQFGASHTRICVQ